MSIEFTVGVFLKEHEITPYRLSKDSGISSNTIYNIVNDRTGRIDKETLYGIMTSLQRLTGKAIEVSDILAFRKDS